MGQTIAHNFGTTVPHGTSFLRNLAAADDETAKSGTVSAA
jgi:hypothetical protein